MNEIALDGYSPEKAGVGGSTPSRGTNYFAATKSAEQIPLTHSKIEAFSTCFHWRKIHATERCAPRAECCQLESWKE